MDEPIELYRRRGERSYRPVAWMLLVAALELVPAVLLSSRPPARDGRAAASSAMLLTTLGALGGTSAQDVEGKPNSPPPEFVYLPGKLPHARKAARCSAVASPLADSTNGGAQLAAWMILLIIIIHRQRKMTAHVLLEYLDVLIRLL